MRGLFDCIPGLSVDVEDDLADDLNTSNHLLEEDDDNNTAKDIGSRVIFVGKGNMINRTNSSTTKRFTLSHDL